MSVYKCIQIVQDVLFQQCRAAELMPSVAMRRPAAFLFAFSLTCFQLVNADERPITIDVAIPKDEIFDQTTPRLELALQGTARVKTLDVNEAKDAIKRVQNGEIDVAIVPVSALADVIPAFGIYDLPFSFGENKPDSFFTTWHLQSVLQSQLSGQGMSALGGVWYGGARVIASKLPRRSPYDFKDSTVAFSKSNVKLVDFSGAGAKSVVMKYSDMADAMNKGEIDAAEVTWDQASKLKPAFVTQSNHRFAGLVAIYKNDKFATLTPAERTSLSQAISDTESYVSLNTTARESRAIQTIQLSRYTASLNVDNDMREQWRDVLTANQAVDIGKIGTQVVVEAKAPLTEDIKSTSLSWNGWFETTAQDVVSVLAVDTPYEFVLDLGRGKYPAALTDAISKQLKDKIDTQTTGDISLLVKPVLMGGLLEPVAGSSFEAQMLTISRDRLEPKAEDETYLQQAQDKQLSLSALARKLSVTTPLKWSLMARDTGCARVVLSIWDARGVKPLDYLVVSVPVTSAGKASSDDCGAGVSGGSLAAGLSGLLDIGKEKNGGVPADAALHLFESASRGPDDIKTVAVFVDRSEFDMARQSGQAPPIYAWELKGNLSLFLGQDNMLPTSIIKARGQLGSNKKQPYTEVVRQMGNALFNGRSVADGEMAARARKAMKRLSDRVATPIVLVRYFDAVGKLQYLPLAMLGANAPDALFTHRITVVQPLQDAQKPAPEACIKNWDFAIPNVLDGAGPKMVELLKKNDWRIKGGNVNWYQDNTALVRYISPPGGSAQTSSSALVLLAHHGKGDMTFSTNGLPSRFLDTDVSRRFIPGSVAVLAACQTVGASTASQQFVKLLVDNGMSAIVASPFQVNTDFGAQLAVSFVAVAQELRVSGEPARFVDIFNRALQKTIDIYGKDSGYADMALEYQIIGDHELRMCASPSSSNL